MRSLTAAWRFWPWSLAVAWGGGTAGFFLLLWITDPGRDAGALIAALANGTAAFFIAGGLGAVTAAAERRASWPADRWASWAVEHPWPFALGPAAAALLILLPMRLAALALDIEGPWQTVPDSVLDISSRAVVVYLIVAGYGSLRRRARVPS
jgi:hypothetical protein